jgi:hypothetical protein
VTFDLDESTTAFAQEIQDLLLAVLPAPDGDYEQLRITVIRQEDWRSIRPGTAEKPVRIPLLHNGAHVANLGIYYRCVPDQSRSYLAVRRSQFEVHSLQEGTPLLRFDYAYDAHSVPAAHWNVHAERGATSVLLTRCNPKHQGLLSKVHLPVGGTRYRPCLEDFLEMLIVEFNIDTRPGWKKAVQAGRERWRTYQTKAIVRDSPAVAADVLRQLGYRVEEPSDGEPQPKVGMLHGR